MGRFHPERCEHGNIIDGGSFYDEDEVGCEICDKRREAFSRQIGLIKYARAETKILKPGESGSQTIWADGCEITITVRKPAQAALAQLECK